MTDMTQRTEFRVVRNEHGHVSIWRDGRANPPGWHDAGFAGTRQECLDHIDQHWHELTARR